MAGDIKISSDVEEAQITAVVFRCQHNDVCVKDGRERPCSECVADHMGVISYYHRNPLKRAAWKIKRFFRRK